MDKSSISDRRTTQRAAARKPVNYLPTGSRKRTASSADGTITKKKKVTSSGSKSAPSNNSQEKNIRQVEVLSDSSNEKEEQRHQSTATESTKGSAQNKVMQADCDEYTDGDGSDQDSGENEDQDQDDGLTDLQGLNHDTLKKTFISEQPHWKERNQSNARQNKGQEHDPLNGHSDGTDDVQDGNPPRKAKLSKRDQDRRDEVPRWASNKGPLTKQKSKDVELSSSGDNDTADSDSDPVRVSNSQDRSVNKGWPSEAFFVPPKQGSRIISLKDQPTPLNKTLSRAIREATGDTLFDNAFPSIDENYKYHRKLLRTCARELKYVELADRFSRDTDFGVAMARLLQQRISNLRGVFKAKARSRVEATFLLISNDPNTITKVEHLTQRTEYIFKPNNNGVGYNKLAPFQHPSIIAILQDTIFKGSRGSALFEKHASRFPILPATGLQPKRRMISEAMVCMAATAVHAVLDDWRSGREIPSDFNADLYQGVYDSHLEFMRYTREGNLAGYQYMMSKIYNDCCVITSGNVAVSNKAMELLDLHNMPVE